VSDKLYDANGVEFRIHGVNRCHYDGLAPKISSTHANAMRWGVYFDHTDEIIQYMHRDNINQKIVVIPGNWAGTCKDEPSYLSSIVDTWVAQAEKWKPLERYMIVNIANEWGPANSTVWRDSYITAVSRLRAAGYSGTLQITSGGCGQDYLDIARYGKDVLNADPQKNILFDLHIYTMWGDDHSWQQDLKKGLDNLKATGLAVIVGEFGPQNDSPPPAQIIQECESRNFGWMAWAWDDRPNWNGACPSEKACETNDALSWDGWYNSSFDLTNFGRIVVENPTVGLLKLGKPATVFN
jgi:hypothetical protein